MADAGHTPQSQRKKFVVVRNNLQFTYNPLPYFLQEDKTIGTGSSTSWSLRSATVFLWASANPVRAPGRREFNCSFGLSAQDESPKDRGFEPHGIGSVR